MQRRRQQSFLNSEDLWPSLTLADSSPSSVETTIPRMSDADEETPLLLQEEEPTEPVEPVAPPQAEPVIEDPEVQEVEGAEDAEVDAGSVPDAVEVPSKVDGEENSVASRDSMDKGIHLTYANAVILETQIHKDMSCHTLAFEYFGALNYYYFTLPQAIFTALSSILAFAGGSEMLQQYSTRISLLVGSLSASVVLFQTISGVKQYGLRSDRHNTAAVQLRDLHDDMIMIKLRLKELEKLKKTKKFDPEDDDPTPVTFDQIQKRYKQCLSACSSTLPIRIKEAFHGLDTNIALQDTQDNMKIIDDMYPNVDHRTMLKSKAYDIIAGEIVNHSLYPHVLPNSKQMVEITMHKLKLRVVANKDFYKDLDKVIVPPYSAKKGIFC